MCRGRVHCRALRYVELVSLHARYEVPEGDGLRSDTHLGWYKWDSVSRSNVNASLLIAWLECGAYKLNQRTSPSSQVEGGKTDVTMVETFYSGIAPPRLSGSSVDPTIP